MSGGDELTAAAVVTDRPGYFPNGPVTVRLLVAVGAVPDARTGGRTPETPRASSRQSP